MLAMWVKVRVKPSERERFLKAIEVDALGSERDEPGCMRFNVLQDTQDQHIYYFYEVYRDEAALEAHRAAPHYAVWRAAADTLDGPPQATRCQVIFPAATGYWEQKGLRSRVSAAGWQRQRPLSLQRRTLIKIAAAAAVPGPRQRQPRALQRASNRAPDAAMRPSGSRWSLHSPGLRRSMVTSTRCRTSLAGWARLSASPPSRRATTFRLCGGEIIEPFRIWGEVADAICPTPARQHRHRHAAAADDRRHASPRRHIVRQPVARGEPGERVLSGPRHERRRRAQLAKLREASFVEAQAPIFARNRGLSLLVAAGNPIGLQGIEDLARSGIRVHGKRKRAGRPPSVHRRTGRPARRRGRKVDPRTREGSLPGPSGDPAP
jgi:autoinducer 2-degrading protein